VVVRRACICGCPHRRRTLRATLDHVEAHREGLLAWAAVRAVVETGEPGGLGIRLTLVLVSRDGAWQVVQSHASLAEGT
jgi:hypothetical protein